MTGGYKLGVAPFEAVWSEMNVDVEQITRDTADLRFEGVRGLLFKALMIVGGMVFVVGLLAWMLTDVPGLVIVFAGIALLLVGAFVGLNWAGKSRESYGEAVKKPLLNQLINSLSTHDRVDGSIHPLQATYDLNGQVPAEKLAATGLFFDNRMVQEDVISGKLGATEFTVADLKWQSAQEPQPPTKTDPTKRDLREYRRRIRERDREAGFSRRKSWGEVNAEAKMLWHQHHRSSPMMEKMLNMLEEQMRENYKLGASTLFFSADFHKDFTSDTYFMPTVHKKGLESMSKKEAAESGLQPMNMAGIELPKGVQGWTNDQAEARYLLTPQLILALNGLITESGSDAVSISFTGSRINIAIGLDENYFSLDPKNADVKASTERIYNDIVRFLSLVEDFNLNTRIWTKA